MGKETPTRPPLNGGERGIAAKPCPNTILSRKGTIISDETDEERTCLLGGGAGRSSERSGYRGIERAKGVSCIQ